MNRSIFNNRLSSNKSSAGGDPITGGLTESLFLTKGEKNLRQIYAQYAVISMQVGELTDIGRTFGNENYRRVVKYICDVLKLQLGNDELLARTGEDTFCFLLKNRRREEIQAKTDNICLQINRYNEGKENTYYLHPIFGIYFPQSEQEDFASMIGKAMTARMSANVNSRLFFYNPEQNEKIENELKKAVDALLQHRLGEFFVYLQPKIRMSDMRIVGAEALVRWRHSYRGMLSPDMFLPAAEQYRLIETIDRFVFEEVCKNLARWQQAGLEACPISINLAAADIARPLFAEECYEICNRYQVSPSQIEFEMKEAMLLANMERSAALIEKFHHFGFRCAVDNFGSDYCSLQLLGRLELDTIKLDSSFFSGGNNSRHGRYLAENVLKLAAQLHIRTVAEGIDNYGQVQFLQQAACDCIQGFICFQPMPIEKFESEAYDENMLKYIEIKQNAKDQKTVRRTALANTQSRSSKNTVMFSYRPAEDEIEFSSIFSPVLGEQRFFKNAQALFRTTDLIHQNDRPDFFRLLERCQREDGWVENTLRFYMSEGHYEWLEVSLHQDGKNADSTISGTLTDMSGWKSEVNRWKEKATRDPLTGLYNREYFEQNVSKLLEKKTYATGALMFIDVDKFKEVNDNYGHMFGDDVLCFVAKQILGVFRHTDIVARYAGDEFVIFASAIEKDVLEDRLKKLCGTFRYPYRSGTVEHKVSISLGAAYYPTDGTDYQTLLEHADCAVYEAKSGGRDRYVIYEPYMKGEAGKNEAE